MLVSMDILHNLSTSANRNEWKIMVFFPGFYLPLDHVPRNVMGISCGISMLVYQLLGAYCVSNQADGASIHKKREGGLMTGVLMKT